MINTVDNTKCPVCDGDATELIKLDDYPLTEIYQEYQQNKFTYDTKFHQLLNYCDVCDHAFLGKLLPQEFLYNPDNYRTVSSTSQGALHALENFYNFASKQFPEDTSCIVDIGANDTSLLKKFKNLKTKLIGIDPNIKTDDPEIECIKDYFENIDLPENNTERKVFLSSHTLEHIYSPKLFMEILERKSDQDDVFIFQFPSLNLLIRDYRFDQIHHQHINLFSIESFKKLIEEFGFELIAYNLDHDHYGTLMASFRKKTSKGSINIPTERIYSIPDMQSRYKIFKKNLGATNDRINSNDTEEFYCFGASLMLPILSYYMPNLIGTKNIIDNDPSKQGLSYVNFDVEIINDSNIDYKNTNIVVTAIATKLATRRIINKLSSFETMNIILPLHSI